MIFDWEAFLERGYFLGSPLLNKVWCLYGDMRQDPAGSKQQKNEMIQNLPFFYRNNFDRCLPTPWITGLSFFEFRMDEFFSKIAKFTGEVPKIKWKNKANSTNQKIYERAFKKIKQGISDRIIQKGVPFYRAVGNVKLTQKNLVYFFQRLIPLIENKNLFFYGHWDFKESKLQFGASPELLFIKKNNVIKTIALAGTSTQPQKDFLNTKMKHEHDYVVRDLFEELQNYGTVTKQRAEIVPFKNYFHQKTKLIVRCNHVNPTFEKLLTSVYPSAAIGAYPRSSGIAFLRKMEEELGNVRGFFAAPFGIQIPASSLGMTTHSDFMLCLSTIRGIEWDANQLYITAGGGVIAQSSLDEEWREIGLKIKSIKSIFGLTQKGDRDR